MRHHRVDTFGDFRCSHCHAIVSSMHLLSGVNNRNHCPYCLWSSHLDLYSAGDRLSACKAAMIPIGLTFKRSRNKYQLEPRGELMLIHECVECKSISINRIAADDDPEMVQSAFQASFTANHSNLYEQHGIVTLNVNDLQIVYTQLFGQSVEISATI
jgi:hypothetical protein